MNARNLHQKEVDRLRTELCDRLDETPLKEFSIAMLQEFIELMDRHAVPADSRPAKPKPGTPVLLRVVGKG